MSRQHHCSNLVRSHQACLQAQEPSEGPPEMSMGLWSGKLKHRMATAGGYSTVDLLNLTALIPDRCAPSHPPAPSLQPACSNSALLAG